MEPVERCIRRANWFLRRRDLLARGYTDRQLKSALADHRIFRVRQGWYSVPSAPGPAIRAVRVGGRLTGVHAMQSHGLAVPHRQIVDVTVPANACRLRDPEDRRRRLEAKHGVRIHWADSRREHHGSSWLVPLDEALLFVLCTEPRDIAVACAGAVMRRKRWSQQRLRKVFDRAPLHARRWLSLVSALDDSHGETFVRLWLLDAHIPTESQAYFPKVGHLDFRVSANVYIEIDGAQHDPSWTGEGESSYENDHDRDAIVAAQGGTTLRHTYRQLYGNWPGCLAAIERAIADDRELIARRLRDPIVPRAARLRRKRRRSSPNAAQKGVSPPT